MPYNIVATSPAPAYVIYLIDVSLSMGWPMTSEPSSERRIDFVYKAIFETMFQMSDNSMIWGAKFAEFKPRYYVSIILYNEAVYNVYGNIAPRPHDPVPVCPGFLPIDHILQGVGIPEFKEPQGRTNAMLGFKEAIRMLDMLLPQMPAGCPAPLVCHLTNSAFNEGGSPFDLARSITSRKTADGNVLLETIFMKDGLLTTPLVDTSVWPGIRQREDVLEEWKNGEKLDRPRKYFDITSKIPDTYLHNIRRAGFAGIQKGAALMFPGNRPDFVRAAIQSSKMT